MLYIDDPFQREKEDLKTYPMHLVVDLWLSDNFILLSIHFYEAIMAYKKQIAL